MWRTIILAMRVVIATGIFPPDIGGPATYVPRIATHLAATGASVSVVTWSDAAGVETTGEGYRLFRISRALPRPLRFIRSLLTIARLARGSDLVFANGLFLECAVAAWLTGTRLVAKIVGDPIWERARNRRWSALTIDAFQGARHPWWIGVQRWVLSIALRRAEAIITPSRYLAALVAGWKIPAQRITVILNGTAPASPAHHEIGSPEGHQECLLVTVTRLTPWKGVERLLEFLHRYPEYSLVVIGDGPLFGELRKRAQDLGVASRAQFLGRLPPSETRAWMGRSEVVVLLSEYEGLPHVLLEATFMGVPVVARRLGGNPEVVIEGVTGELFDGDDLERLHDTIVRAASLRGSIERVQGELHARFSLDTMLSETTALLLRHATR